MVFEAPQGALQTPGGVLRDGLHKKSDGSIGSKEKLKSSKKQLIKYSVMKKAMKKEGVYEKGAFVPITQNVIDAARKIQKKKK
jgi:hypothetical protein